METRITNLTSLPIGSYTIGINGKTISAGEYYHRVRSFVSASNPSKVPTVTAHILPKLAGGGVKKTINKDKAPKSEKVAIAKASVSIVRGQIARAFFIAMPLRGNGR